MGHLTAIRRAAFAAPVLLAAAAAVADTPKPAAPAQQRTTMLGSHAQEFLLAKISVSDLPRSYAFYTQVIGLKPASPQLKAPRADDPEVEFREIPLNFTGSLADPFFVLVKQRGAVPEAGQARLTWIGFKVPDAKAAIARAEAAGASVVRRPADGAMAFGYVRDPDGYTVEFIQAPAHPAAHSGAH